MTRHLNEKLAKSYTQTLVNKYLGIRKDEDKDKLVKAEEYYNQNIKQLIVS
jgi:hypothetical protein